MTAEKDLIGQIIMDPSSINDIPFIKVEMFQHNFYGMIFQEYAKANSMGRILGIPDLINRLKDSLKDSVEEETIVRNVKELVKESFTTANIKNNAKVVEDIYKAKQLSEIISSLNIRQYDVDEQIGHILTSLESLITGKQISIESLKDIVDREKSKYFKDNSNEKRIKTLIPFIDNKLLWLERKDVTVIGARPGVGKSALSIQVAMNIISQGFNVAFFNLEMNKDQIFQRIISSKSQIDLKRIRNANYFLNDEEERYNKAVEELSAITKLDISEGILKMSEMKAICRNGNYDVIIIDYLQIVIPERNSVNRVHEVGEISRMAKIMASELNCHVILLSQLNRASENKPTKEPQLTDLRESGEIEQDASNIIFLWNTDEEDLSKKGIKVAKARQGEQGKEDMVFKGSTMTFEMEAFSDSGFKKVDDEDDIELMFR